MSDQRKPGWHRVELCQQTVRAWVASACPSSRRTTGVFNRLVSVLSPPACLLLGIPAAVSLFVACNAGTAVARVSAASVGPVGRLWVGRQFASIVPTGSSEAAVPTCALLVAGAGVGIDDGDPTGDQVGVVGAGEHGDHGACDVGGPVGRPVGAAVGDDDDDGGPGPRRGRPRTSTV